MSPSMRPNKSLNVVPLYQKEGKNMQEKIEKLKETSILEISIGGAYIIKGNQEQ